jgi:hypothetical protein
VCSSGGRGPCFTCGHRSQERPCWLPIPAGPFCFYAAIPTLADTELAPTRMIEASRGVRVTVRYHSVNGVRQAGSLARHAPWYQDGSEVLVYGCTWRDAACPLLGERVAKLRRHCPNRKCVGCGRNPLPDIGSNSEPYFPVVRYENQNSNRAWSIEPSETSKIVLQHVRG